jgi:transcriptional regulator with PAS, ATPase and Fis domain/ligand-binding sensor domain-containing protein
VYALDEDSAGRLWLSIGGRVWRRDGTEWTALPLGDTHAVRLLVDSDDGVWIGTEDGELIEWRGRIARTLGPGDGLPEGPRVIEPQYEDRDGRIWVHTWPGVLLLNRQTGILEPAPGAVAELGLGDVIEDQRGRLWIGGRGDALFMYTHDGHVTRYPITDTAGGTVESLLLDREGHIWFGVSGGRGGLHRLSPERVRVVDHEQGLLCGNVMSVTEAPDGTVWVATFCPDGGAVFAIRDGRIEPVVRWTDPESKSVPAALLAERDGVWVGTFQGELWHIADGQVTRPMIDSPLAGDHVYALHRDEAGALWIGTRRGLHRNHKGHWTTFRTEDGLVDDEVRSITADRHGTLWIGTRGGVSRYANGRFTNLTTDEGLARGQVRAIYIDAEDTAWIGTYGGGLCRLKQRRIFCFGTQDGLLDSGVHRILEDDRGYLWMSGNSGIRRVSRRELNGLAEGKITRLSVRIYDEHDGMKNAEANGMVQPAGWRMRDGTLWFPTQAGIVQIDPASADRRVSAPPVIIEELRVNRTPYDVQGVITAPPGSTELEIHYTAPSFSRPEQTQFRYRLEGHDADWVDAGRRRVAHYTNLAPGTYRFRVMARSSSGLWNEEGAEAAFTLQPMLHQRRLVQCLAAFLLVAAGYAAFRVRVAHLRRRARALEGVVATRTAELRREREGLAATNSQLSEAKEAVEASHAHLVSVLDQLRVGVIVVDGRERVLFASQATCRLIVGSDDGVGGHPLDKILPVSGEVMTAVRGGLKAPQPGTRVTAKLEPGSGQRYWTEIEVRVDPRDERHRILYLYDVTETFELKRSSDFDRLIGSSSAMRVVHAQIRTLAGVDATVLIEGETGTGKELVARSIHEASARRHRPFLAINCAGLTESLLASQLFGHKRGAFTGAVTDHVGLFEAAQGGTLLLDEIGDMPMSMQTHLLRVLQEREIIRVGDSRPRPIDVRVLASTHRSLEQEVAEGRFREDLFYRIRVAPLVLPPLRERTDDIPQLASAFVSQLSTTHGKDVKGVSREVMDELIAYRWPGNVRELRSTIEWAIIHAPGPVIKLSDLPPKLPTNRGVPPSRAAVPDHERRLLLETLQRAGGNRSKAARLLGVSRNTLYRRLAALDEVTRDE